MIHIKTPEQIEEFKVAGSLSKAVLRRAGRMVRPGITTREIDQMVESFIRLHGSKDELASRLSVSRAAVYRELSRLQAMGLIQVTRQGVSLKDAEALERQLYDERNEGAQPAPANNKE